MVKAACSVVALVLAVAGTARPQDLDGERLTDEQVQAAIACGAERRCKIAEAAFGGRWLVATHGNITTSAGVIAQLSRAAAARHGTLEVGAISSRLRYSAWVFTVGGDPPRKVNYAPVQNFDRLLLFAKAPNGKPDETPIQPEYLERVSRDWGTGAGRTTTRSVIDYFDPAVIPSGDFFVVTIGTLTLWHEVSHSSLVAAGLLR